VQAQEIFALDFLAMYYKNMNLPGISLPISYGVLDFEEIQDT
jgi:hypothetical protein